jgi:HD-GYP domain-containing protein (c-di-GMP phosphodiesterase class II)
MTSRFGFKLKLFLSMAALLAIVLGVTYVTLSRSTAEFATRQAREEAADLLNSFSAFIGESLAAKDRMQLHVLGQALSRQGVSAQVTDRSGEVLFSSKPEWASSEPPTDVTALGSGASLIDTAEAGGHRYIHGAGAARFGGNPVGVVEVWLDRGRLEERMRSAYSSVYPFVALAFGLMLALVLWVVHATFGTLKRLGRMAERIGGGDLTVRVPVRGRDELARFCQNFNDMADGLQTALAESERKSLEAIKAMISSVEAKDRYTKGHCIRVRRLARRILLGMSEVDDKLRARIETAALLHDIGKIGIPDHVLLKESELTPEEIEVVRTHVSIGEKILSHIDALRETARWVRHHHERWDGFGYPDGVLGPAIPLASRVIAVADTIDAMMTDRPYRKALGVEDMVQVLLRGRGKQFDPDIVDRAIAVLKVPEELIHGALVEA